MIDLHTHTSYSDGTDSLTELLKKAEEKKIDVISITDHDHVHAYLELEKMNIKEIYSGKIIVGCEFTTSYKGKLIEVLGFNFDYHKMDDFLEELYSIDNLKKKTGILKLRLIDKFNQLGLEFNREVAKDSNIKIGFFEKGYYQEIKRHPENLTKIKEPIMDSFSDFYRKGLTNPDSFFYIGAADMKINIQELADKIHELGGICFLAHPYQYKLDNTEEFINDLYDNINLDGIECYYTIFSDKQTGYLLEFARERNLLVSGGSDYHGKNKINHDLGIGRGNMNIPKNILDNWPIDK